MHIHSIAVVAVCRTVCCKQLLAAMDPVLMCLTHDQLTVCPTNALI